MSDSTDLDLTTSGGGGSSVGGTAFTQTLNALPASNTLNHALGCTVINIVVYDGTEQIPVSNWVITDTNNVEIEVGAGITNATIYVIAI